MCYLAECCVENYLIFHVSPAALARCGQCLDQDRTTSPLGHLTSLNVPSLVSSTAGAGLTSWLRVRQFINNNLADTLQQCDVIWKISPQLTWLKGPASSLKSKLVAGKILPSNQRTRAKIILNVALLNNNAGGWVLLYIQPVGLKLRSISRIVKYADVPC